ncbi:MAG: hypothetical protein QOK60_08405 [Nitrososphaeraceae archaeon]|jgi:hypothetical protein|nr:hypothetical protein [Nitrososphaeraceae archaeon]MDW0154368.1 hypothetical protein [Nitrososphaeraceae archaeon]MDW0157610.1 hypothetical protein [Nitrososphaeraceae archaeon]
MMNKKTFLGIDPKILTNISVSILAILVLSVTSGVYAQDYDFKNKLPGDNHGDNNPSEKNCKKSDTLEEISVKIDAEKCEIDDIKNYKEWNFYKLEDPETKQCLTFFEDLGGSLVDYEVVYCYAYPEKYDEKNN